MQRRKSSSHGCLLPYSQLRSTGPRDHAPGRGSPTSLPLVGRDPSTAGPPGAGAGAASAAALARDPGTQRARLARRFATAGAACHHATRHTPPRRTRLCHDWPQYRELSTVSRPALVVLFVFIPLCVSACNPGSDLRAAVIVINGYVDGHRVRGAPQVHAFGVDGKPDGVVGEGDDNHLKPHAFHFAPEAMKRDAVVRSHGELVRRNRVRVGVFRVLRVSDGEMDKLKRLDPAALSVEVEDGVQVEGSGFNL